MLYNPELKSAPVMIPGLLGLVVMFVTTLMTSMGVVKEREYGTMEQQAMQFAMFTVKPQVILSGLIFPLSSLPRVIQYIAYLVPLTYFVAIAKGMFIKGQGLDLLWPQALVMAGYAILMDTVASLRFRRRIA